jgi:hypothetical protein
LRQILSHIRKKAVRVKTGERQAACVKDLLSTFQRRRLLRRRSSEPSTTEGASSLGSHTAAGSPAASTSCLPGSPARPMSKEQVWALYGLRAPTKCAGKEVVDLCSSEEEVELCEGNSGKATSTQPAPQPTTTSAKPHYDVHLNAGVRTTANGQLEKAVTEAGPDGFLIGRFLDGNTCETEVPNLAMTLLPLKATAKQPAQAKKKGKLGGQTQDQSQGQGASKEEGCR